MSSRTSVLFFFALALSCLALAGVFLLSHQLSTQTENAYLFKRQLEAERSHIRRLHSGYEKLAALVKRQCLPSLLKATPLPEGAAISKRSKIVQSSPEETVQGIGEEEEGGDYRKFTGHSISLKMDNAPISEVIVHILLLGGLSVAVDQEVAGTIDVDIQEMPWDEAFDRILKENGLDKVQEGSVVRVAPKEKFRKERENLIFSCGALEEEIDEWRQGVGEH